MAATVTKVSLAIGQSELAWARKRAKREGTTVSRVLTDAARLACEEEARRAKQDAAWREVMKQALGGRPLTEAEREAARRELDE